MNEYLIPAMLAYANTVIESRNPDVIIGNADDPYVHRWWIGPHGDEPSAYIHRFFRSDHGALHDHRYDNVSVILDGDYYEHVHKYPLEIEGEKFKTVRFLRKAGQIVCRDAGMPHRISLIDGLPVTTIFFTGKAYRNWGFHTPQGWIHWKAYLAEVGDARPGGNYAETAT